MVETGGKQGSVPQPGSAQVSVSPQGFPSEKNSARRCEFGFAPLFTGELFFGPRGLRQPDSYMPARELGWHVRQRVVARPKTRQMTRQIAAPDSLPGTFFQ